MSSLFYTDGCKIPSAHLVWIGKRNISSISATRKTGVINLIIMILIFVCLNYRTDTFPFLDEFDEYQNMIHGSEIDLPNLMSERNYAQLYLNGKQLRVGSVEVNLKKIAVINNYLNPVFCRKYL